MKTIKALLSQVYGEADVRYILDALPGILARYTHQASGNHLTERDAILITYPDQVRSPDHPPLQTLDRFLRKHVGHAFTTVHLLPFYPYSSDDGFSVTDYYAVNPAHGTWQDIRQLSVRYRLMFDAVINHISRASDWFKGFLAGDRRFDGWFLVRQQGADYSEVVRPRTHPLFHRFTAESGNSREVWTTFSEDQVDLNYQNPEVFLQVLDVLLYYCSKGAGAIRLDAIGFLWKEPGTTCIHLPQTHLLIKVMRNILSKVHPDLILITETNVPHDENISYFGNGHDEAHMVYNFTLPPLLAYSILSGTTGILAQWAQSLTLPEGEVCLFNFTASHDGIGLRPVQGILNEDQISIITRAASDSGGRISYKSNPDGSASPYEVNCNYFSLLGHDCSREIARKRMLLSQAFMIAFPGVPGVYFHSLVGSQNDLPGMEQQGYPRAINREKSDFAELDMHLEDMASDRSFFLRNIKHLLDIRSSEDAFYPYGSFAIEQLSGHCIAINRFKRTSSDSVVKCVFNMSAVDQVINLPPGSWHDLVQPGIAQQSFVLGPCDFAWLSQNVSI